MTTQTTAKPAEPKAGEIRTDIPIDAYHAGPGISSSQLAGWGDTCPAYWKQDRELVREPSPAMVFGDLCHVLTLEPERIAERYAIIPGTFEGEKLNRSKKAHKEFFAAWLDEIPEGATQVSEDDYVDAKRVARALQRSTFFKDLLGQDPLIEASFYWEDERTGLLCKVRPDWFAGLIGDIKTTRDSSAKAFGKQICNLHYDTKAAYYLYGIEQVTGEKPMGFVWAAINRDRAIPEFYQLDDARQALGNAAWRKALDELAVCMDRDEWPSFTENKVKTLPLEPWRVREFEAISKEVA